MAFSTSRRAFLQTAVVGAAVVAASPSAIGAASSDDLAWTPAWKLREMMTAKQISPVEYARFVLDRVERHGKPLGAFITVFPEQTLAAAKEAEDAIMRGDALGPLHGLPISVKDTVWTKGQRTTMGSLLFKDFVPDRDAVAVERVRAAGGIIFAKTNTPEFAMNRRSINLVSREAVNPWDRTRTSGGSSGGAGVAIAAGITPVAVGTDGGGSIRLPSAFNGIFGLYPSQGRVPNGAGFYASPQSGIGPMSRDVRDAAMLFQVMAGYDGRDAFAAKTPTSDYLKDLESGVTDVRMGWSGDLGRVVPQSPEIVDIAHKAAKAFAKLGARYEEPSFRLEDPLDPLELDPEYSPDKLAAQMKAVSPTAKDVFTWASELPREDWRKLSIYMRDRTDRPTQLEYAMSIRPDVRYRARTRMADLFSQFDLVLSPTIARIAPVCGETGLTPWEYTAYTYIVNSAGYCAASVPAGFYKGMPVGLQIIGRPNEEALVLRAARAFEKARPWAQHRPPNLA